MTSAHRPEPNAIRILDGGTGSELRRRGVRLSDRCWSAEASLSHPALLLEIHSDYIRAGADIITANTFATSRFVLAGAGLEHQFSAINRAAADLVHEARRLTAADVTVAASMSCLPPMFDSCAYPAPEAEYRAYAELATCFAQNGIELILLEMMQHPLHAARACRAARESGLPFWAGVSCRIDPHTGRLVAFDDGDQPIEPVFDAILDFEPAGISIMHSPIDATAAALETLGTLWRGQTGAYAEITGAEDSATPAGHEVTPEAYAGLARHWQDLGASLIGGCCGTTPAHIRAIAELRQA